MKKVCDIDIEKIKSFKDLFAQFSASGGFQAKNLGEAAEVFKNFFKKDVLKFLSFPADIISTGARGVINYFLKNKIFDVVITTCGTLDHDLARSFVPYYHGSFFSDDAQLLKKRIHRLGNVFIPFKNYGKIIENKMTEFMQTLKANATLGTYAFCWQLGEFIAKEESLLYQAARNKIPIIIPAIYDGAVGYQLWALNKFAKNKIIIDSSKDEDLLNELVWKAKRSAALIVGGGISKHHLIWWNQFKNGLDYAIYISTATEYDGSLSGAQPKEAVSWSKIKANAKYVSIFGEATVILPLLAKYLYEELILTYNKIEARKRQE